MKHFVHAQHHTCVNITHDAFNVALYALLSRARTVLMMFDVIVTTKLHVSVLDT